MNTEIRKQITTGLDEIIEHNRIILNELYQQRDDDLNRGNEAAARSTSFQILTILETLQELHEANEH